MGLDIDFKIKVFNSREVTQLYGLKVNEITLHLGSLGSHYLIKDWIQKHKDYEGDEYTGDLILEEKDITNLYNVFSQSIPKSMIDKYFEIKYKYENNGAVICLIATISE